MKHILSAALFGLICASGSAAAAGVAGNCPVSHRHMGHGSSSAPADDDAPSQSQIQARQLAQTVCSSCHGAAGVSIADDIPNLAGQEPLYLCSALEAYRSGERQHAAMNTIAAKLSDAEIISLSELYAHQHIHH